MIVADDHALVRQGMAEMLSTDEGIQVVGEAENGAEAVALAREKAPDVMILDVDMPVMGAQPALRRILEISPPPKVIIVTVFADQRLVRELLRLGASAYLSKNVSMRDLIATVHSVASGKEADNVIVSTPRDSFEGAEGAAECALSRREMEVLLSVARGMSSRDAGASLHVSETTIKRHLSKIYAKMEVGSRNEAIRKALSEGWISAWDISKDV